MRISSSTITSTSTGTGTSRLCARAQSARSTALVIDSNCRTSSLTVRMNGLWYMIWLVWILLGTADITFAAERALRAGVYAGHIGFTGIGIGMERALDENNTNAAAYTLGTFSFGEVDLTQQVRRYYLGPTLRPVVGLGLCEIAGKLNRRVVLSVSGFGSAGLDWTVFDTFHCGAEVRLHCALYNYLLKSDNGMVENVGFFPVFLTPAFGLYLQRELDF